MNQPQPGSSALDMAWAVAWMEAGEACPRTDDARAQVRDHKAQFDYLRFTPGTLDTARDGAAAAVTVLR